MIPVLFENDEILIIDKPFGLPSQPGESVQDNVIEALARQTKHRLLPVHRLDKDTSGCMILAKNSQAARRWSELIVSKEVKKRYLAWVAGQPARHLGTIDIELKSVRGSQEAETLWRHLETWVFSLRVSFANTETNKIDAFALSLFELELKTGRMHQIRRHLASIGHPILADDRHGDFALNKALRRVGVKRLMLWARELDFSAVSGWPGGASILSSEPTHFAALREMLAREGNCHWRIDAGFNTDIATERLHPLYGEKP